MSGPWEKYSKPSASNGSGPWDNYSGASKTSEEPKNKSAPSTVVRQALSGATGGFLDEASGVVEAAGRAAGVKGLGGSFSDVGLSESGPTLDMETLKSAYTEGRDRKRGMLQEDRKNFPATSFASEIAGGVLSPVNKVVKGMSAVRGGATLGGIYGLGNSESDSVGGIVTDTAVGSVLGAGAGKAIEKATPYLQKGAEKVSQAVGSLKKSLGEKAKGEAEEWAFKSTGAMLKDFRAADDKGEINKVGRWILDKGLRAGQTVDDVAAIGAQQKESAAVILDEVYNKAGAALSGGSKGFDPIRDKNRIMEAARRELGDTVGGDGVLNQLSSYIDDLAMRRGDGPNNLVQDQFRKDLSKYKSEYKNYLKQSKEYKSAFGSAADEEQQILQGFNDDSQRAVGTKRNVELNGKPAEVMTPASSSYNTQMDLLSMPTGSTEAQRLLARPGEANFGVLGGETVDRVGSKIVNSLESPAQLQFLSDNAKRMMSNQSAQGNIAGTGIVPRTYQPVDDVAVRATGSQLKMNFQPSAPQRPVRPAEIRNPMAPRRSNEIKGAFDDQINYSRNPLLKEPAKEKVFSGARRELNDIILESIDSIDDKVIGDSLRKANLDYGMASKVSKIANDRVQRESANKFFGLTDNITGVGGVVASLMTGNPLTGLAIVGVKKAAEKYGSTTTAVALDALSKRLLRDPQMQNLAKVNPQSFNATVIRIFETMDARNQLRLPKAAESEKPKKGYEKWASDGLEKLKSADTEGILSDPKVIEKLNKNAKGQGLLLEANQKGADVDRILLKIKSSYLQGAE